MLSARFNISRALLATRRDMPFTATIAKRDARDLINRAKALRNGDKR